MQLRRYRVETKLAGVVDFDEVHLGGPPRAGVGSESRGSACRQNAGTFQLPLEGAQAEPLPAGKLDLRQTAFAEAC
jgi:hypothetical protein